MKNIVEFLGGVRKEFAKVMWPTWSELVGSTTVVLAVVFAFSLYLGALDFMLGRLTAVVLSLKVWG